MNGTSSPHISVCIPAYKRTGYLKRLLQSLSEQTYDSFEVIVTDDSDDDSVEQLTKQYENEFPLLYYKNEKALGTPANWNHGISLAKGEWIKLIHDDDWLASPDALAHFAKATKPGAKFIFSAYTNYFEDKQLTEIVKLTNWWKDAIGRQPATLIAKNVIGPPSVTLVHRSIAERYDERLKWRVDTDFYERVLRQEKSFYYISTPLVNVGISESQVTQSCLYKPEVELPEGLILLQKYGTSSLKNMWVYDAWWRLFRNMNIKTEKQLQSYTSEAWPTIILRLLKDLRKVPEKALQKGVFSKGFMMLSFLKNRNKI